MVLLNSEHPIPLLVISNGFGETGEISRHNDEIPPGLCPVRDDIMQNLEKTHNPLKNNKTAKRKIFKPANELNKHDIKENMISPRRNLKQKPLFYPSALCYGRRNHD